MVVQEVLIVLGILFASGALLSIIHEYMFEKYLLLIALIIALPLVLVVKGIAIILRIIRLLWNLSLITLRAVLKSLIYGIIATVATVVLVITYFIPHLGDAISKLRKRIVRYVDLSKLSDECHYTRNMMVEIVEEQENRSLTYKTEAQYRDELIRIKERGKQRLDRGELVLSLFIGSVSLLSQVYGFGLLQQTYWNVSVSAMIQFGLLMIVLAIVYRVLVVDLLAYNGDEEFASIEEMDVALSYQEAISYVGFVKLCTFLVVLGLRISNADRETFKLVLTLYSADHSLFGSLRIAWNHLRMERSG